MYHTSPTTITDGTINKNGVAGNCLFFSDDIYVMTASDSYYVYEADFDCVRTSQLHDEEVIAEIAGYFNVDSEVAESLLDGSEK